MDVPGGDNGTEPGPVMKPDADGVVTPASKGVNAPNPFQFPPNRIDAAEFCYYGFSQGFRMVDVILDPEKYHLEYKPEVMLTFGTNLYTKAAAESERISEALRRIPFIASISYHLDEHTAFADIVLPESSVLERTLMATITERKCWSLARPNFTGSLVQQPVVPAMYQSRQADAILLDLAERAGILKGKTVTCFSAIRDDVEAAGATWVDREVRVEGNLVTSRKPDDLPAFCREILRLLG